jgi:5-methylcytosine-specific restriction endonuclease McrA
VGDVLTLDLADVDRYADVLTVVAVAIVNGDLAEARARIAPIAFERWEGWLRHAAKTGPAAEDVKRGARDVTDRVRAQVFLRDEMTCTYCGGRCIPRSVLVAFSDLFPDELPYHPNYRRGAIHPVYWALAPEADHVFAYARGGSGDIDNLTTLHTMCNARKADAIATDLPEHDRPDHVEGWDGLLSAYPSIATLGESHGRRHSSAGYHLRWFRHFNLESA